MYSKHILRVLYTNPVATRPTCGGGLSHPTVDFSTSEAATSTSASTDADDDRHSIFTPTTMGANATNSATAPEHVPSAGVEGSSPPLAPLDIAVANDELQGSTDNKGESWAVGVSEIEGGGVSTRPEDEEGLMEATAADEKVLSEGVFDPEAPHKPDSLCAPRSLAVHPDGLQVKF